MLLLVTFTCAGSVVAGISLRPVFADASDGIFHEGQEVSFAFELRNLENDPVEVEVCWQVATDEGETVKRSSPSITRIPGGKDLIVHYSSKISSPGFYKGSLFCSWDNHKISKTLQVGYAPEKIVPPLTRESDFEEFWRTSLRSLRKIPPEFRVIHQPELSTGELDVYEVRMRSYGNTRVKGWYEVPKTPGPHPVLLRVPGYGSKMRPISQFGDMIVLSFNPRGHGNSQDDVKGQPRNFWVRGLDNKEGYFYQGAYLDCVRAVDFLCCEF